jgi:hypothetical protein
MQEFRGVGRPRQKVRKETIVIFRLNDAEVDDLERHRRNDESSLNKVARKILVEALKEKSK